MVRRASLAHHWIGASNNSFDKLTTPSANDPELAEGPEQASVLVFLELNLEETSYVTASSKTI